MNKIKKQEKKQEKEKILKRIIQIINDIINYNNSNNQKQSSIFSGIDFINHNKEFLHHLHISLRTNSTKGVREPFIPPLEIYDMIIDDKLTVRVNYSNYLNKMQFNNNEI